MGKIVRMPFKVYISFFNKLFEERRRKKDELTRKKIGHDISHDVEKDCPFCHGKGRVFAEETVARFVRREGAKAAAHLYALSLGSRAAGAAFI